MCSSNTSQNVGIRKTNSNAFVHVKNTNLTTLSNDIIINENSNNNTNIGNDNIEYQTDHFTIDEISIARNVNNKLSWSTKSFKFHYANSIALDKDTKRKTDILGEQYNDQSAIYENHPPMNENTNNPYPPSILTEDQYSTQLKTFNQT